MAGGCKAAIGCVDARVPVRASYVSLYKWPESDAEFVRSVAMARRHHHQPESPAAACYSGGSASMRRSAGVGVEGYGGESPRVVDSYSCRQMYLRSYTFATKKETVPERTMACLGRVRERAAVFPSFLPNRSGGGVSDAGSSFGSSSGGAGGGGLYSGSDQDGGRRGTTAGGGSRGRRKRRRKNKGCAVVRRLQEASCGAVRAIFRRLLACTTTVDVEVAEPPPYSGR